MHETDLAPAPAPAPETAIVSEEQSKELAVQEEWKKQDDKVKKGAKAFVQVGLALTKIKKEKLYKEGGYNTFADYVADRIDMSEQQTRKLRSAADVAEQLRLSGVKVLPTHESQIRALTKFKKDKTKYKEIWVKAVATAENEVSAKHVLTTAKELYPESYEPTDAAAKKAQEKIDNLKLIQMSLKDAGLKEALELFEAEHKKALGL